MTRHEFRAIRTRLGLSQSQLAIVLGYRNGLSISNFEREAHPRRVPFHVDMLMRAFDGGFRPETWRDAADKVTR